MSSHSRQVDEALQLAQQIKPLLAGRGPMVQSAALCDLVAMWLAGHPRHLREALLANLLDGVKELTDVNERIMFGDAGHPGDRS